jgi:uncharacterized protein YdhG (YjbR/CyaY superfamily)
MTDNAPDLPTEVVEYIESVAALHRPLFDRLHRLALANVSEVSVIYSYNMPAYVGTGGRVSLSDGPHGVSLSTRVPAPIAVFHDKHGNFKVGKVSVLFPADANLPEEDVAELIRSATS